MGSVAALPWYAAGKVYNGYGCRVLRELRVENYAVIDNVVVEFGPGLNLLTGETGAGKSILVDAIELLMAGAAAVQVCTAAILRGPTVFGKIAEEVATWLGRHGYARPAEVVGLALGHHGAALGGGDLRGDLAQRLAVGVFRQAVGAELERADQAAVYDEVPVKLHPVAARSLAAHLDKLLAEDGLDKLNADAKRRREAGEAVGVGLSMFVEKGGLGPMDGTRVTVDTTGAVVGVLSQTDLLRARVVEHLWVNLKRLAVRHVMTAPAITVPVSASLDDAAELMEQRRVHRLVVVGPDGTTPVGVLSVTDLVHVMAHE